jgi:hypothetical protein
MLQSIYSLTSESNYPPTADFIPPFTGYFFFIHRASFIAVIKELSSSVG